MDHPSGVEPVNAQGFGTLARKLPRRPAVVAVGVLLLCARIVLIQCFDIWQRVQAGLNFFLMPPIEIVAIEVTSTVLILAACWFVFSGQNWARIILTTANAVIILWGILFLKDVSLHMASIFWSVMIVQIMSLLLLVAGTICLIVPAANIWFRACTKARVSMQP